MGANIFFQEVCDSIVTVLVMHKENIGLVVSDIFLLIKR